ncbi:CarD family transcriptional regulator [bacterium]|nr:CarD family transcriptional regulator [bacterium]
MDQFKPGDLAVYPNHGVGEVLSIESRMMGDSEVSCYVVNILSDGSKVIVPVETAEQTGLRNLIDKKLAQEVYDCFKSRNLELLKMNWNKRYRFLQDKMKTGKVTDVATVISDLMFLKKRKGLSYGEERLLSDAEDILATELSITENLPKEEIVQKFHASFKTKANS